MTSKKIAVPGRLTLSRRIGEKIVIDGKIVVTVVGIDRGKIRLSIECDRSIPVFRSELLEDERIISGACGAISIR